jgi:DNA-binding HxlR family transcriptional regulator
MRTYGQYCPIARGSEILAERWTPIILRNLLLGCTTFNDIAAGAPGLSRALLTTRLRELQRAGVIVITPKPGGRGSLYEPTPAGRDAWRVLKALGQWGDRWTEVLDEHADPRVVLWTWCEEFVATEHLPQRRVVVRFDHIDGRGRPARDWLLIEHGEVELCKFDPGFGDDLVVTIVDPLVFARWHLGLLGWGEALRSGGLRITGDSSLRRAFPTWNAGPRLHDQRRESTAPTPAVSLRV